MCVGRPDGAWVKDRQPASVTRLTLGKKPGRQRITCTLLGRLRGWRPHADFLFPGTAAARKPASSPYDSASAFWWRGDGGGRVNATG